jgi:hypothetical protein
MCCALVACLGQATAREAKVIPAATVIGGYYTDELFEECDPATQCRLTFSAVPGSKSLLITLVTCHLQLSDTTVTLSDLQLLVKKPSTGIVIGRIQFLAPQFSSSNGQSNHYGVTAQTSFLVLPGEYPVVEADAYPAGDIFMDCSITGQRPSPF